MYYLKLLLLTGTMLSLGIVGFLFWAAGKSLPKYSELKFHERRNAPLPTKGDTVKVLTYNVAHGQGLKDQATDWRDKATTLRHLDDLAAVIAHEDADIVLLQEVDIAAKRTHQINQLEHILARAPYQYFACATVWKKNYLPFPFWPPKHHLGAIESAICILSKHKITKHDRLVFDKPAENAWWYNMGYIDRAAQRIEVDYYGQALSVVNVHLEAWSKKTRQIQANELIAWLKDIKNPLVLGGDLNSIPTKDQEGRNFEDDPGADYLNDQTVSKISKFFQEKELKENLATFPADKPNRWLDHLFARNKIKIVERKVIKNAANASDHLPVAATLALD